MRHPGVVAKLCHPVLATEDRLPGKDSAEFDAERPQVTARRGLLRRCLVTHVVNDYHPYHEDPT